MTESLQNEQNDRIYLASSNGMVQCLREIDLEKPAWVNVPETDEPAEIIQQDNPAEGGNEGAQP